MFSLEIFGSFRLNCEHNCLKNRKENIYNFPNKFVFYQRNFGNSRVFLRLSCLARQSWSTLADPNLFLIPQTWNRGSPTKTLIRARQPKVERRWKSVGETKRWDIPGESIKDSGVWRPFKRRIIVWLAGNKLRSCELWKLRPGGRVSSPGRSLRETEIWVESKKLGRRTESSAPN